MQTGVPLTSQTCQGPLLLPPLTGIGYYALLGKALGEGNGGRMRP